MSLHRHECLPLLVAILLTACGGSDAPANRTPVEPPTGATVGALRVTASTTGESITTHRYVVRVGSLSSPLNANGSVRIDSVPSGQQSVAIDSIPPNCQVAGGNSKSIVVAANTTQDVAFDVSCSRDDTGALLTVLECPALRPAAVQGRPLAEIALGAVPAELVGELVARVSTGPASATSPGIVLRTAEGSATLIVPLHPSARMSGGDVVVRVGDQSRTCPPFALRIDPLPEAPGEFLAVLQLLQSMIERQATALETSVAMLQNADVDTLPTVLLPLMLAQSAVDFPGNANSLRALHERTDDETRALLDALLALAGIRESLAADVSLQAAQSPWKTLQVPSATHSRANTGAIPASECTGRIAEPRLLDACMEVAWSAAFDLTSPTTKVLNDMGSVLGLLGLAPSPATRIAAMQVGLLQWARQVTREGTANLLPSSLKSLTLDPSPTSFNEDQGGPGTWGAKVMASSKGWQLEAATLNAVLQLAGARQTWITQNDPSKFRDDLLGVVLNAVVQKAIQTSTAGAGLLAIPPETFGPVDVSLEEWSAADIPVGTSIVTGIHSNYLARAVGISQLRVQTLSGRFGGQSISNSTPIEVRQLQVRFTRGANTITQQVVRSSTEYEFIVRVENSSHPEMIAIDPIPQGAGSVSTSYLGDGATMVRYTAPAELDALPFLLTARHTASTGARAFSEEPRVATVAILPLELRISPTSGCVKPGEELAFTATLAEETRTDVVWSASVGSISSEGVYTAPASAAPGTEAEIEARLVTSEETFEDAVRVEVGTCTCSGTLTLGAPISRVWDGLAGWSLNQDGFQVGLLPAGSAATQLAFPERSMNFGARFIGSPDVGSFPIHLATLYGGLGPTSQVGGAIDPTDPGYTGEGSVSISAFRSGEFMQGVITGSIRVVTATYDAGVVVPMQFTFRALYGSQLQPTTPFFQCYLDATSADDELSG